MATATQNVNLKHAFANFKAEPLQKRLLQEAGIQSPTDPKFKHILRASLDFVYHAELFFPDPNDPSKPLRLEGWQKNALRYAQWGEAYLAKQKVLAGEIPQYNPKHYFNKKGEVIRKKMAINSPRGFGKSVFGSVAPDEFALHFPYTKIALFSTSQEQANDVMEKVKYNIQHSILNFMIDKKNNSKSHMGLINGSIIKSFPQSEVTIRGFHPHIKVIDEKSRIKREILESAIRPMGRKTCWLEVGISTPFGRNNNHYEDCHDPDNFYIMRLGATDVSWVDQAKLKTEMAVMGERIAKQELFGEFLEDADTVFHPAWIENMLHLKLEPKKKGEVGVKYIMGADFGKDRDYSAFCIGHKAKNGNIIIDHIERHRGWNYKEVINRMVELCDLFDIYLIVPDGKGVGIAILDYLVEQVKVPIYESIIKSRKDPKSKKPETKKGFIFTNRSKLNLVGEMERIMMNGNIKCPHHFNATDPRNDRYIFKILENEMIDFSYTRTADGNIRFSHPEEGQESHDDTLISAMLMVWGFRYKKVMKRNISGAKRYSFGRGDKITYNRRTA